MFFMLFGKLLHNKETLLISFNYDFKIISWIYNALYGHISDGHDILVVIMQLQCNELISVKESCYEGVRP